MSETLSVGANFQRFVASRVKNPVRFEEFRSEPDGKSETDLYKACGLAADFGKHVADLTKTSRPDDGPNPEVEAELDKFQKEFERRKEGVNDAMSLVGQICGPKFMPIGLKDGPDGFFALEVGRLASQSGPAILEDVGLIQGHGATIYIDTTPGKPGVIAAIEMDLPESRPEFLELCGKAEVRNVDASPGHPVKQAFIPLLTSLTDLWQRQKQAEANQDKAALAAVEKEADLKLEEAKPYKKLLQFIRDGTPGEPVSVEDKKNGICVLNLEDRKRPAGQIVIDTRPNLAGIQVATIPLSDIRQPK